MSAGPAAACRAQPSRLAVRQAHSPLPAPTRVHERPLDQRARKAQQQCPPGRRRLPASLLRCLPVCQGCRPAPAPAPAAPASAPPSPHHHHHHHHHKPPPPFADQNAPPDHRQCSHPPSSSERAHQMRRLCPHSSLRTFGLARASTSSGDVLDRRRASAAASPHMCDSASPPANQPHCRLSLPLSLLSFPSNSPHSPPTRSARPHCHSLVSSFRMRPARLLHHLHRHLLRSSSAKPPLPLPTHKPPPG
jgi:hypothetical protein